MAKRLSKTLWYGTGLDTYGKPLLPPVATNESDLNGLHRGELFMHLDKDNVTLWALSSNNEVVQIAGKQGEIDIDLSDYLLKSTWDKVWELRKDNNGVEYIYSKLPVVTRYGITMYADNGEVEVESIYAGLPIDNVTLYWDNGVLKAKGGEGGGGVADSIAWANVYGKPSWVTDTKPIYNYSEINNTPDLSVFVTGTSLSGILADYATLSHLTGELKKYVTIKYDQDIVGVKNFSNGIKISNMPIRKLQDDVIYIDANVVVRGGVTMYADGGSLNIPSIYDGLPIDGVTLVWEETADGKVLKINPNIDLGGGLDEDELNAYLTNNNYAKKSDITSALSDYAPASALNAVSTKLNDFLEGSDTDTVINKWKELETFLSGLTESDNLATILTGKADKSYVDANFVTIAGTEDVTGLHNFVNGLKVGGIELIQKNGNAFLKGNLVVEGGITMYGDGEGGSSGGGSVSGDYLPLSGGKLTSNSIPLTINRDANNSSSILFQVQGSSVGILGFNQQGILQVRPQYDSNTSYYDVWHKGNLTPSDYLLKSSYTASDVLTKLKTVDGYGSGLAADILGARDYNGGSETSTLTTSIKLYEASRTDDTQIRGIYDNGWHLYLRNVYIHDGTNSRTILHSGNYSNHALPLSGGTLTGTLLSQIISPKSDNTYSFGYSNYRWAAGYFANLYVNGNTVLHSGNISSYNAGSANRINAYQHNSDDKIIISGSRADNTFPRKLVDNGYGLVIERYETGNVKIRNYIATLSDNVASATKLQTARTIWGQSFDGTGNVSGHLYIDAKTNYVFNQNRATIINITSTANACDLYLGADNAAYWSITARNNSDTTFGGKGLGFYDAVNTVYRMCITQTGNVGIGTTSPSTKLHVNGGLTCNNIIVDMESDKNASVNLRGTTTDLWQISARYGADKGSLKFYYYNGSTWAQTATVTSAGNVTVLGGITMYSDQRKKTILNHVELSLKQIADAPLIQHYYNSDQEKTTHVSSIAQYWAGLNDWFCKLDNEGFYTMEIQNAALASAISIARHLEKYESKTDKKIRQLKKRISQLENEIELLKKGA